MTENIIDFASRYRGSFRCTDVVKALSISDKSKANITVLLNRMVLSGKLTKLSHGVYSLSPQDKLPFIYHPTKLEKTLSKKIKDKFPFIDFCIWNSSTLTPFMQHVPSSHITFIDVERVAVESVFYFLQEKNIGIPILINPKKIDCERYITNEDIVIVRTLINESPCLSVDDCPVPTLEKILVDATRDRELSFLQGNELYTIFKNVFEIHDVNRSRLLRYANRRNRKDIVNKLIESNKLSSSWLQF